MSNVIPFPDTDPVVHLSLSLDDVLLIAVDGYDVTIPADMDAATLALDCLKKAVEGLSDILEKKADKKAEKNTFQDTPR